MGTLQEDRQHQGGIALAEEDKRQEEADIKTKISNTMMSL